MMYWEHRTREELRTELEVMDFAMSGEPLASDANGTSLYAGDLMIEDILDYDYGFYDEVRKVFELSAYREVDTSGNTVLIEIDLPGAGTDLIGGIRRIDLRQAVLLRRANAKTK